MLWVSYASAATAMLATVLYLFLRLRLFLTTTTMLVGSLLLIYGPAFLSFTLSSGEKAFLIQRLSGSIGIPNPLFPLINAKVPDFDAVLTAMNFSVASMYLSIIAGIEAVDRLFPKRIATMRAALINWNAQSLHKDIGNRRILLIVISVLLLLMMFFSIAENHIATIWSFLSIKTDDEHNVARNMFRLHFAGSPNYWYRLVLGAIAPMFVIWGLLAGGLNRSWALLLTSSLLLIATMIGKSETLSKAPPAFFLIQLMIATILAFTNRITWRSALGGACVLVLVLFAVTRLIMTIPQGIAGLEFIYFRVFETENQALLENFATFPFMHPYMWGANLRPVAMLTGLPYIPAFSIVANTWYGTQEITNPALFIADAWADFSYPGVIILFSLIAGAFCCSIDAIFLVHGKTVVSVTGLLLAPLLAGLLVTATRYFGQRYPLPTEHVGSERIKSNQNTEIGTLSR
jgi:hypothetical protein